MGLFVNLSPDRLVRVWEELCTALHNKNSYGGDICEIYVFTMLAGHSPTLKLVTWSDADALKSDADALKLLADCRKNLISICQYFQETHSCQISVLDDNNIWVRMDWWCKLDTHQDHRWHVKVEKSEK